VKKTCLTQQLFYSCFYFLKDDIYATMPLSSILKWTKVNAATRTSDAFYSLAIVCKDLSVFHLGFHKKEPRRYVVAKLMACCSWTRVEGMRRGVRE
jgi:hypothetical protein